MNYVDRILANQSEILQNQAAVGEHLRWLVWLMGAGVILAVVVLALQGVILAVKTATRRDIAEMKETLALIKQWAYSAKSHASDAQAALKDVKTATAAIVHPTPEEKEIATAVKEVARKIDEMKRSLPPALVAGMLVAGSAFADQMDAVQEMREQNAAIALADWRAGNP